MSDLAFLILCSGMLDAPVWLISLYLHGSDLDATLRSHKKR